MHFCIIDILFLSIQLSCANNEKEFKDLLMSEEYDFRYACGVGKSCIQIPYSEKDNIVETLSLHCSTLASLAELEQVIEELPYSNLHY